MCFGRAERTWDLDDDEGGGGAGSEVGRVGCLRIEIGPAGRDAEEPRGGRTVSDDGVGDEDARGGPGVETRLAEWEDFALEEESGGLFGCGSSWTVECGKVALRGDFRDGLVEVDEASELDVEVRFREELGVGVEVEL